MKLNRNHRGRRGQALAEMAVMVPFLVIGMMGFLDLGRAFYYQISITNAVREAARYAAQSHYYGIAPDCSAGAGSASCPVPGDSAIFVRLNQELQGIGVTIPSATPVSTVTVSPDASGRMTCFNIPSQCSPPTQYPITVTATYQFTFITPFIGSLFGGSITLRSFATMRTDY
ncbi:MAG TPA: TadE/TadG family type IV pilus assembly protein [Candidatus Dormibacteraeota bacterium]|nr:TadE/TadG family type IV pilus assembly protein [Candidatus Dormibacteraeota bacterium]